MRRISVTVSDAMYDCLVERAVKEGESPDPSSGRYQKTLRHALRYYLAKNGPSARLLDLDDKSYRAWLKDRSQARPVAGNGDVHDAAT